MTCTPKIKLWCKLYSKRIHFQVKRKVLPKTEVDNGNRSSWASNRAMGCPILDWTYVALFQHSWARKSGRANVCRSSCACVKRRLHSAHLWWIPLVDLEHVFCSLAKKLNSTCQLKSWWFIGTPFEMGWWQNHSADSQRKASSQYVVLRHSLHWKPSNKSDSPAVRNGSAVTAKDAVFPIPKVLSTSSSWAGL